MKLFKQLYIENRFFYAFVGVIMVFLLGYPIPFLFNVAKVVLFLFLLAVTIEILWLFNKNISFQIERTSPKLLSLGDDNTLQLSIKNLANAAIKTRIIEELPVQLQERDFMIAQDFGKYEEVTFPYTIRPTKRGLYSFGDTILFLSSKLGFVSRQYRGKNPMEMQVYPSIIQMKKYELAHLNKLHQFLGIKKIRRIGHSYDFEQIKEYVQGDDYRSLNWKATGRYNRLMVNQYQDQSAQPVYCIIDKSRYMKLPFNGMSLLDYSVNASLVISNTALKKKDKTGLITFSDKLDTVIKADNKPHQLKLILESLYNEKERMPEANYELLYTFMQKSIRQRSLLFLFSNLESKSSMNRILPILKGISKNHLVVVIFFENNELTEFATQKPSELKDIYLSVTAQKFISEKEVIIQTMRQNGIHTIFTRPEQLTMNALNKYLEFKARGLI
ncbi:MAG: DUF58 domain-containing protein [Schleiferiaceae bacterium]|jgi:uncharacterized protein (DUF58 family)|nr:DUF58 domain-containing protein [Schleiferiaceae bacterium]